MRKQFGPFKFFDRIPGMQYLKHNSLLCEVWAPIEASYGFGWQQGLSLLVSAVSQASPLSESRVQTV